LLGLSFKAGTDDLRYSPSLALARELISRGARVIAHDPAVPMSATAEIESLQRAAVADSTCDQADLVILATEWPEYGDLDWSGLLHRVHRAVVFDGRNMLNADELRDDGWTVIEVGRSAS
jgi:UDPglucose 6-dehydrogenase